MAGKKSLSSGRNLVKVQADMGDPPANDQPDRGAGDGEMMGKGEEQKEEWNRCLVIPVERERERERPLLVVRWMERRVQKVTSRAETPESSDC